MEKTYSFHSVIIPVNYIVTIKFYKSMLYHKEASDSSVRTRSESSQCMLAHNVWRDIAAQGDSK